MPYLIDGHNLIGQMPDLSLTDPDDEVKLVARLRRYMARHRKRGTVVFDGGLPGGLERQLSTSQVTVIFAHGGTTADAIILGRIRRTQDASHWTIVSADRAITSVARQRRMRVVAPADFATELRALDVAAEDDPNPTISPDEVDDWLRLFGQDSDYAPE